MQRPSFQEAPRELGTPRTQYGQRQDDCFASLTIRKKQAQRGANALRLSSTGGFCRTSAWSIARQTHAAVLPLFSFDRFPKLFWFRPSESDLTERPPPQRTSNIGLTVQPVDDIASNVPVAWNHFAQFPELWEVTSSGTLRNTETSEPLLTDRKFIKGLSGMTLVLPAWSIVEVLNMPPLRKLRADIEAKRQEHYLTNGFPPETGSKRFATLDPRFADDGSVSEAVSPRPLPDSKQGH